MFNFGAHLKELRKSKNITQKQLAADIGASERGIQQYELGERKPTYDMLVLLADYFDVSLDFLTGRSAYSYVVTQNEANGQKCYGIKCTSLEGTIKEVNDITASPKQILELVELISRNNLSMCHLMEVVVDQLK